MCTCSSDVILQFSGLGVILPMYSYYFLVILSRNGVSDNFRESTRSSDVILQFRDLGVILPLFSCYFSVILSRNGVCQSTTSLKGFFSDNFRECTCSSDVILMTIGILIGRSSLMHLFLSLSLSVCLVGLLVGSGRPLGPV